MDAVIVVNHRSHRLLDQNLVATTRGLEALVVVVDNFSTDDERAAVGAVAAKHGWELVTAPNDGFGAGVNAGVARARALGADAFLVLNPDLELAPETARALLDAARADRTALLGPQILDAHGEVWFTGGLLDRSVGRTRTRPERVGPVPDWLTGACLAVHDDLWSAVGGFSDDFFMYWEDIDLSVRVAAAGGHVEVLRHLSAVHDVGGTQETAGSVRKSDLYYRHNTRGRMVFAARNLDRPTVRRWAWRSVGYARDVVLRGGRRQLLRSPGPVLAVLRGTWEGLVFARRDHRATAATAAPPAVPTAAAGPGATTSGSPRPRRVVVAHPSPDLYGSDRQMLESVDALVGHGWAVDLVLPARGPLAPLAAERGAQVRVASFPVLRKALLHPVRLPGLVWSSTRATAAATRWLRRERPDVLYVNTVTIPVWQLAGRLARVPVLVHVHEAEEGSRLVATGLAAPLLLAHRVLANSAAAAGALTGVLPRLASRVEVVHNGVPGPPAPPTDAPADRDGPAHLVAVGRLSPRKGTDVALEAVALLAQDGVDVRLSVAGTPFEGYEWFVDELEERAARPDLSGRVELLGYVHPTWDLLASADVVLVPSRLEPFGNTAVEALRARRAVVASGVQGLAEVVRDGETGLLVPPDAPAALADAVRTLLEDDALRSRLARAGEQDAVERFTTERYGVRVVAAVEALAR